MKVGTFPERPVSFSVGTVTLAGILHVPIADGVLRGMAVVLVPEVWSAGSGCTGST